MTDDYEEYELVTAIENWDYILNALQGGVTTQFLEQEMLLRLRTLSDNDPARSVWQELQILLSTGTPVDGIMTVATGNINALRDRLHG